MREFKLINGNGAEYSLNSEKVLFHDPTGLGFEKENITRTVGNRWVVVKQVATQLSISGSIAFFGDSPYAQYEEFSKFINVLPLKLLYKPLNEYFTKDVVVTRLGKGDINEYGYLDVEVDFTPLSPWYKTVNVITKAVRDPSGWVWPVTWPVTWRSEEGMRISIFSDSYMDSPCKLSIEGPVEGLSWKHYANGEFVSEGAVNYSLSEGSMIVIDNTTDPYRIIVTDMYENEILDIYNLSDFATDRFVNLKNGRNTIIFSTTNDVEVTVKAEAKLYYDTV